MEYPNSTHSFFRRGSLSHYHKPDEEYPALHAYPLYPGLVVAVVRPNPHSRVQPGHVGPVLTRGHRVGNDGRPESFPLGIGGSKTRADFAAPPRGFPQRRNWGVIGDRVTAYDSKTGTNIPGVRCDVDDIGKHAGNSPKGRVLESLPNLAPRTPLVYVGQPANQGVLLPKGRFYTRSLLSKRAAQKPAQKGRFQAIQRVCQFYQKGFPF